MKLYDIERTTALHCRHRGDSAEDAAAAHARRCISTVATVRRISGLSGQRGHFEALRRNRAHDTWERFRQPFYVKEIQR